MVVGKENGFLTFLGFQPQQKKKCWQSTKRLSLLGQRKLQNSPKSISYFRRKAISEKPTENYLFTICN